MALIAAALALSPAIAHAAEVGFLNTLGGDWGGDGSVRIRTTMPSMPVKCRFSSTATESSMSLAGQCTSLAIFSRPLSATVKTNGKLYTGTYLGSKTGPATLRGTRSGNALNLEIRWARNVNGDRSAQLRIEKIGGDRMRLTTIDTNPQTGKIVITSQIDLRRL
ncbi:hypothetical protein SAZ10_27595 [Mesorhizobium sp. BAC0120]|uniref:hypothetical protein n=1 Tax=Mesorhizobium sp. BAC0120 TaxID=3090670 RepID=UPI00298C8941|nr:hypothetical protein [Mesorhizobium sp. BAC0120]MDW6025532.1 hypothetical protein [Mesorhizobium sp. BAC0120]